MKLISLNIWGGKVHEPLIEFFKKYQDEIDIFCLQEAFNNAITARPIHDESVMNIFDELAHVLPNHTGYFNPSQTNEEGIATFARNDLSIKKQGDTFVFRWLDAMENNDARTMGRNMQYIEVEENGKSVTIANVHGLWNGVGKTDTEDRLEQSKNIKSFLGSIDGDKILCGDFNLLPDTHSLALLEDGYRNLVKEKGITSTRSHFYSKPEKFADYILVTPDVEVKEFKVLEDVVSDHLPLLLEFN
jgi:endonuclease/exonuclease/phosphatase family metal-dependent hydrolase